MTFLTEFQHDFLLGKPYDSTKCYITEQEHKQVSEVFMGFFESLCERLRIKLKDINEEDLLAEKKQTVEESESAEKEKKKLKQWKNNYELTKQYVGIVYDF